MSLSQISDDKVPLFPAPPLFAGPNWNSADAPADGQLVEVFAEDRRGPYLVPSPVRFQNDWWLNASTGQELEANAAGWRPWPGKGAA